MNKEPKFKIGDCITVLDTGKCYDGYRIFADKYRLDNWFLGELPDKSMTYTITLIAPHDFHPDTFCYVINNKKSFIMGECIKLSTGFKIELLEDSLFEI